MTFICVLRLVTSWFPARRIPLVTQLTGPIGQFGALLAASPMTWALANPGWTRTYLAAGRQAMTDTVTRLLAVLGARG